MVIPGWIIFGNSFNISRTISLAREMFVISSKDNGVILICIGCIFDCWSIDGGFGIDSGTLRIGVVGNGSIGEERFIECCEWDAGCVNGGGGGAADDTELVFVIDIPRFCIALIINFVVL